MKRALLMVGIGAIVAVCSTLALSQTGDERARTRSGQTLLLTEKARGELTDEQRAGLVRFTESGGNVQANPAWIPAHTIRVCKTSRIGTLSWLAGGSLGGWLCSDEAFCPQDMQMIVIDENEKRHTCNYSCNTTPASGYCDCSLQGVNYSGCPE